MQNSFTFNSKRKYSYNKSYEKLLNNYKKKKESNYDFVKPFHEISIFKEYYKDIFLSKKVFRKLCTLLGPDLAFLDDPSFTLNVSSLSSSIENYHFKNFHQELWSGANTSNLVFWSPIFMPRNKSGQLYIIKDSHLWGNVPNNNRSPTLLPKKYKKIKLRLNIGDILLFHPLLLHASEPIFSKNFSIRLAITTQIKNFKNHDISYNSHKNWKIFSMSDLTKIEKKLGNHFLTPYRTKSLT